MEPIPMSQTDMLPHLVHVYQPHDKTEMNTQIIQITHPMGSQSNLTFQSLGGQTLEISPQHVIEPQSQGINNLQASNILTLQDLAIPTQQLQIPQVMPEDMVQITQHVIYKQHVPVYKSNMVLNEVPMQYFTQFDYEKSNIVTKLEPEVTMIVDSNNVKCKTESEQQVLEDSKEGNGAKRRRNATPNPNKWACNVRKVKHQRGEAYISRRGKYVPEKQVQTKKDCLKSCKFRCSTVITDTDREHIFKAFYSLNSNEKKHFLLNTTERCPVKYPKKTVNQKRRHFSFKYFFLVRAVRYTVCKDFYLGTLAISQKPVYNVHLGKNDWNIPKPDGRGHSEMSAHSLPSEVKERAKKHVLDNLKTTDTKQVNGNSSKKQFVNSGHSIKQLYRMYVDECKRDGVGEVKESMYRKIIKRDFNVQLKKMKVEQQLCCKCKGPIKKK